MVKVLISRSIVFQGVIYNPGVHEVSPEVGEALERTEREKHARRDTAVAEGEQAEAERQAKLAEVRATKERSLKFAAEQAALQAAEQAEAERQAKLAEGNKPQEPAVGEPKSEPETPSQPAVTTEQSATESETQAPAPTTTAASPEASTPAAGKAPKTAKSATGK